MTVTILKGDCRDVLKTLPSNSAHCCDVEIEEPDCEKAKAS